MFLLVLYVVLRWIPIFFSTACKMPFLPPENSVFRILRHKGLLSHSTCIPLCGVIWREKITGKNSPSGGASLFSSTFDLSAPSGRGMQFKFQVFLHSKNEAKICKICEMAKIPLLSGRNAFAMTYYLGLGGYLVYKNGLGFSFRALEVPFLVPPRSPKMHVFLDLGGTKNGNSSARNKNPRPLLETKYPP